MGVVRVTRAQAVADSIDKDPSAVLKYLDTLRALAHVSESAGMKRARPERLESEGLETSASDGDAVAGVRKRVARTSAGAVPHRSVPMKDIVNVNGGPDMIWVRAGEGGAWTLVARGPRPDVRVRPPSIARKHSGGGGGSAEAHGSASAARGSPPQAPGAAAGTQAPGAAAGTPGATSAPAATPVLA